MAASGDDGSDSAGEQIDRTIAELGDWRGKTLSRMRKLITKTDKGIVEEVKWVKPTNPNGRPHVDARRDHLHRRDLQGGRQAHVRPGRVAGRSGRAVQLEPRRGHSAGHRRPRG